MNLSDVSSASSKAMQGKAEQRSRSLLPVGNMSHSVAICSLSGSSRPSLVAVIVNESILKESLLLVFHSLDVRV